MAKKVAGAIANIEEYLLEYERPYLYPKQLAAIFDSRRYSFIEASTKAGKTSACIVWIFEQALHGSDGWNYWWIAPISGQADIAFRRALRAIPQELRSENQTLKTITLINGAIIWFKSADKPDSLYGEDVYAAVMDEASRTKEDAWFAVRSTLTATRGPIRIIGNVKGRRSWFYQLARKAERGEDPNFGYHKITAIDAIAAHILDQEEIDDARKVLPEAVFKELYLAEPSDDQGNPFGLKAITKCVQPMAIGAIPVVFGWDFAKSQDWTVGCGLDEYGRLTKFDRLQLGWEATYPRIHALNGLVSALCDATGVGDPIVERLQKKSGSKYEGYVFSQGSKQRLMEGLAVAIQNGEVSFPDAPDGSLPSDHPGHIRRELEQFEFEYTRTGVRYCMDADTPVLTADLRYVPVGQLKAGDNLVGFDEEPASGLKVRKWRSSFVTDIGRIIRPSYKILLEDGTEFICSAEHRWLTASSNGPMAWLTTSELRGKHRTKSPRYAAHQLLRVVDQWSTDTSYEAGYLAAAFDGEGSLSQLDRQGRDGCVFRISLAQRENAMLGTIRHCLSEAGFTWSEQTGGGTAGDVISIGLTGGSPAALRLLGQMRPKRLLAKFDPDRIGALWTNRKVSIESVEFIGDRELVAMGTSTKTFVADGFATHNSAPEGFHDDCVMALALAVMHRTHARLPMKISKSVLAKAAGMGRSIGEQTRGAPRISASVMARAAGMKRS